MGGLFGSAPKAPKPTPLPDTNSPAIKEAESLRQRQIMARSGRAATNLNPSGQTYGSSYLGS